jgi:hypothetical protein
VGKEIMKVVGRNGESQAYLVETKKGIGFIADLGEGKRYSPQDMNSITSRGYWQDYPHDPLLLKQIMDLPEIQQVGV